MNDLRAWIGVLAVACVSAGLGAGFFLARWLAPSPPATAATGAFPDYERMLAQTFELSPARREVLRVVLESYETDLEGIKDRGMADYMSSIEPELRERGRYYRDLIRDRVLPPAQRERFDLLAQGLPAQAND